MKRPLLIGLIVCVVTVVSFVQPAAAFLGFGDIVFDPSNYVEAIQQLIRLEQQYTQLVQTYQMVRNQYDQMLHMAKAVPVDMRTRYRALRTPWATSSAGNAYGTTGAWINGINTGRDVIAGYMQASQRLDDYGSAIDNVPADQRERVKTSYATVELTDGANVETLGMIGRLRANAPAVETAIQGLEDDSLSSDPNMNTEIAVLNKINAANLITVRNSQDTNKLLVALAEQEIINAKRTRDTEAQMIRNHARFMADGRSVIQAQAKGASEAIHAWRMP